MTQRGERDYRLDFCRGLALIVIFVDHVPGNPLSQWTLRKFAFCDAAEIFVLISGIAAYLAYGSKLDRLGFRGCVAAVARRWTKLYFAHLLLLGVLALFAGFVLRWFTDTDYVRFLRMGWMFERPREAIPAALTLRFLPTYLDILPLYLILLGAAPALIFVVKRDWRIALAGSGLLYAVTQWTGINLTAGNDGAGWYFNPFAWQFLYTVGIVVGHFRRNGTGSQWQQQRPFIACAAVFIGFAAIAAAPWAGTDTGLAFFNPPIYLWPANKAFLHPLRLLNVLALMMVFAYYVSPQASMLRTKVAAPLLWCGQHSLPIYGFGVFLSCAGYVAVTEGARMPLVHAAVNVVGIALLIGVAAALELRKSWGARAAMADTGAPALQKAAA
jgi:hypothetical protein